jgi:hypothetical protein
MDYLGINSPTQLPQLKELNIQMVLPSSVLDAQVALSETELVVDEEGHLGIQDA